MPGWSWQKTFGFLKVISFLHPNYHPKIVEDVLKIIQRSIASVLSEVIWLMTMKWGWKWKIDHIYAT